jgi:hypothetical protein
MTFCEAVAAQLLHEYDIATDIDPNLFLSNPALLTGDLFLSEPMHTLANTVAAGSHKVYLTTSRS